MINLTNRALIQLTGKDRFHFLQGIITQDIRPLEAGESDILYGAILNPQGKIRFSFFLYVDGDRLLMDVPAEQCDGILKILSLYKLRADVTLTALPEVYLVSSGEPFANGYRDPRHENLGYRGFTENIENVEPLEIYETLRFELGIPEDEDFVSEKAYVAEYGLEFLHGVSFTKGCYVGQEVVARMKHRSTVHKAIYCINSEGALPEIGAPVMAGDKKIGELRTHQEHQGLALIRRDKLPDDITELSVGRVKIKSLSLPEWFVSTEEAA
jgi:folate-binding protein YgfZ